MDTAELTYRVAVVTGAARGIGRDYAEALAADGAHVLADLRGEITVDYWRKTFTASVPARRLRWGSARGRVA